MSHSVVCTIYIYFDPDLPTWISPVLVVIKYSWYLKEHLTHWTIRILFAWQYNIKLNELFILEFIESTVQRDLITFGFHNKLKLTWTHQMPQTGLHVGKLINACFHCKFSFLKRKKKITRALICYLDIKVCWIPSWLPGGGCSCGSESALQLIRFCRKYVQSLHIFQSQFANVRYTIV